jgi:hypothetical protein
MRKLLLFVSLLTAVCSLTATASYALEAGCDPDVMSVIRDQANAVRVRNRAYEMELITRNESTLKLTCFDKALALSSKLGYAFADNVPANPPWANTVIFSPPLAYSGWGAQRLLATSLNYVFGPTDAITSVAKPGEPIDAATALTPPDVAAQNNSTMGMLNNWLNLNFVWPGPTFTPPLPNALTDFIVTDLVTAWDMSRVSGALAMQPSFDPYTGVGGFGPTPPDLVGKMTYFQYFVEEQDFTMVGQKTTVGEDTVGYLEQLYRQIDEMITGLSTVPASGYSAQIAAIKDLITKFNLRLKEFQERRQDYFSLLLKAVKNVVMTKAPPIDLTSCTKIDDLWKNGNPASGFAPVAGDYVIGTPYYSLEYFIDSCGVAPCTRGPAAMNPVPGVLFMAEMLGTNDNAILKQAATNLNVFDAPGTGFWPVTPVIPVTATVQQVIDEM